MVALVYHLVRPSTRISDLAVIVAFVLAGLALNLAFLDLSLDLGISVAG
jgi:hypothetical protein